MTGLRAGDIERVRTAPADALVELIPAGVGGVGTIRLSDGEMDAMLRGGASWAVERGGCGRPSDLERIEEHGRMPDARPELAVPPLRRRVRQRRLGHYSIPASGLRRVERGVDAVENVVRFAVVFAHDRHADAGRDVQGVMIHRDVR